MFEKKTVNGVLNVFTKAITNLEHIEELEKVKSEELHRQAVELEAQSKQAVLECERAGNIAEKLRELVA